MNATLELFARQVQEPIPIIEPGEERPTWTEQHRRECEARQVMKLSHDERRAYYLAVRVKRGEDAARELVTEVNRQWKKANEL